MILESKTQVSFYNVTEPALRGREEIKIWEPGEHSAKLMAQFCQAQSDKCAHAHKCTKAHTHILLSGFSRSSCNVDAVCLWVFVCVEDWTGTTACMQCV